MLDRSFAPRPVRCPRRASAVPTARVLVVALALSWVALASAQSTTLTFDKAAAADGVWIGTTDGDVRGTLTTVLITADTSTSVWNVAFYWVVTAADPAYSFVARLEGTLDTGSGEVAMRGRVVDGYRVGAAVDETGSLYDADRSAFRGTIVLHGS